MKPEPMRETRRVSTKTKLENAIQKMLRFGANKKKDVINEKYHWHKRNLMKRIGESIIPKRIQDMRK